MIMHQFFFVLLYFRIKKQENMPVKIPASLPAVELLKAENIFVMDDLRASSQDIRPLKLLILNLMPLKIVT